VKFFAWKDTVITAIYGYPDADLAPTTNGNRGAPSILIPAPAGQFKLEIQDAYGHGHW